MFAAADIDDHQKERAHALAHLRKESLDLYNRIHSIAEDIEFVDEVCNTIYPTLPVLPNLRCGAWYVDPSKARHEPAYFKSTDGHFNNWSFNLRRPNLHLLSIVVDHGGFILVDSTRAGKRIPDALSKTVPIWCAVINRAVKISFAKADYWNTNLYCPPGVVSQQEHSQIEQRLDAWAEMLITSSYTLPNLSCPLRPLWITPATSVYPQIPQSEDKEFFPIICLSASKKIQEGVERRSGGFSYVQGSGDDHELWGQGLQPQMFWRHKTKILATGRSVLADLVAEIVAGRQTQTQKDWTTVPTPISKVNGRILISSVAELPSPLPRHLPTTDNPVAYVIISSPGSIPHKLEGTTQDPPEQQQDVLRLELSEGKKGQLEFLQAILPKSISFIGSHLCQNRPVCICCENGKDASIGVALAVLQTSFNEDGSFTASTEEQSVLQRGATKSSISTRLQWIISSRPQANPSRATLKRVNEFLLTSPSFRRQR